MKVLLCHAYYMQRGGEDCCFEEERDMLRAHGHEVFEYVRKNDGMTRMNPLAAAMTTVWNRQTARDVAESVRRHRPDVVHLTNTFPIISPSACYAARREGAAVVQALHNYRWMCAGAYLMRDGKPCEDCMGRLVPWPAIVHRCYRESASASAAVAAMQTVHRAMRTWTRKVDAFFTLTEFARGKFVEAGFPAERIHVKSNSVAPDPGMGRGAGGNVVFVGRLSPEKGVLTLLNSWQSDPALPPLSVIGDGPLAADVQAAAAIDPRITWRGQLPLAEVHSAIADAIALVMPSLWYETFGRTIAEGFAVGTPAVASRLGAMAELVDHGRTGQLFEAGNSRELAASVRTLQALSPNEQAELRRQCRAEYERRFTAARNYDRLVEIYEIAIRAAGSRISHAQVTAMRPAKATVATRELTPARAANH